MNIPKFGGVYEVPSDHSMYDAEGGGGYLLVEKDFKERGKVVEYATRVFYDADGGLDEMITGMSPKELQDIVDQHIAKYGQCFNVTLHRQQIGESYSGVTVYSGYPASEHVVMTAGYSPHRKT
jgi:hypothetical protein